MMKSGATIARFFYALFLSGLISFLKNRENFFVF